MPHVAHVPGDVEEYRRERGERDVRRPGREQQDDEDQEDGVNDAGERAGRAVADVRRGAGDRARRRESAEQRRQDVGRALPDQFLVRVVPRARHAVGDDGRQQRLDGAEQRDRECRADELKHLGERQARPLQRGQGARNAAESGADRRDVGELPDRLDGRRRKHCDERRRHAPEPGNPVKYPAAGHDDREREERNARRRQVEAWQRLDQRPDLLVEMLAGSGRVQAEEILPLADQDDHRDTRT